MSSAWDNQPVVNQVAAPSAPEMGSPAVDTSAFSPEQWQAYQQAYQQAMQAQQLYAQAQQWYEYATQTGQIDQQQQASQQAAQAQQLYEHAHQIYAMILAQVQASAPVSYSSQHPNYSIPVPPTDYPPPQVMSAPQAPQGYAPQVAPYQQQDLSYGGPSSAQPGAYYSHPQPDYHPSGYPPSGVQPAYGQPNYNQPAYGQPNYNQPTYGQSGYGLGMPGGTPSSMPAGYDPLAQASEYSRGSSPQLDGWVSLETEEAQPRGSVWFWIIGLLILGGGLGVLTFLDQTPSRKPNSLTAPKDREPSREDLEKQRRALLGEDQERPSEHLRKLSLTRTGEWKTMILAGTGDCRSLYLTDDQGVYVAEGIVPKSDPDYLQQTHPDQPFNPQPLSVPKSPAFRYFATSHVGNFLLFRTRVANQSWLLIYPLVGNPLKPPKEVKPAKPSKKSADDDGPSCGDSRISSHLLRRNLVMIGDGSCNPAAETLGVEPKLCMPNVPLSNASLLTLWHTGRDGQQVQGVMQIDQKQIPLARRVQWKNASRLGLYLKDSTPPTPDTKKNQWLSIRRSDGLIWTLDQRLQLNETSLKLTQGAGVAVRAKRDGDVLWVVYPQRIIKFQIDGNQLQNPKTYNFGTNIAAKYAVWSQDGNLLLVLTEKNTLYQFSEDP